MVSFRAHHGAPSMVERALTIADAIGSAALHPYLPLLATSAGSRTFRSPASDDSASSSDSSSDVAAELTQRSATSVRGGAELAIWDLGRMRQAAAAAAAPSTD